MGTPVELRQLLGPLVAGQPTGGRPHRTPPFFKTKKLAIVGCTGNIAFAPWTDPSWTIASHCSARPLCKREPDWYFDMHRPECFEQRKTWNREYYQWLCGLQTPIFMQEDSVGPWAKIPAAVRYPIERITAEFATSATGRLYATNHAAYMIALAMTEGVTHIGLFGCQYANDSEYAVQRDSLSYWMGRFEQAGGRLVVPQKWNSLLSYPKGRYGYDSHDAEGKLVDEYRQRPSGKVTATKEGAPLTPTISYPVDPDTGACEMPLMALPDGEPVAVDRLKQLLQPELVHA